LGRQHGHRSPVGRVHLRVLGGAQAQIEKGIEVRCGGEVFRQFGCHDRIVAQEGRAVGEAGLEQVGLCHQGVDDEQSAARVAGQHAEGLCANHPFDVG
jgi:hypothetical protein